MEKLKHSFAQRLKGHQDDATRLARAEARLNAAEAWFDREFSYDFYQTTLTKFFDKYLMGLNLSPEEIFDLGKCMVLMRDMEPLDQLVLRERPTFGPLQLEMIHEGLADAGNEQRSSWDNEGTCAYSDGVIRQLRDNLRDSVAAVRRAERLVDELQPPTRVSGWEI